MSEWVSGGGRGWGGAGWGRLIQMEMEGVRWYHLWDSWSYCKHTHTHTHTRTHTHTHTHTHTRPHTHTLTQTVAVKLAENEVTPCIMYFRRESNVCCLPRLASALFMPPRSLRCPLGPFTATDPIIHVVSSFCLCVCSAEREQPLSHVTERCSIHS